MTTCPPRVLSLIPPMTQLNTPYPSTAYLTGFLRSRGVDAVQEDLALALVLRLFSADGLAAVREAVEAHARGQAHARSALVFAQFERYPRPSARRSPSCRGATRRSRTASPAAAFLPEGPRFKSLDVYVDARTAATRSPGPSARSALQDRARHLATLYLNDLADVLRDAVDPRFEFVRYAENRWREPADLRAAGARRWRPRPTWWTARWRR